MSELYYYEGLSCPVCKRVFQNDEDVVACPHCGLPHHRSCWNQAGGCQMADKHGTEEQWSRHTTEPTDEPKREAVDQAAVDNICDHCHTRNTEYAEFCQHCGKPLKATDWHSPRNSTVGEYTPFQSVYPTGEMYSDTEKIGSAVAKDLAAVVGNNASYYIPQFRRLEKEKRCNWNWAAFLLGPYWLLYRKQYFVGISLLTARTIFNIFGNYWLMPIMRAATLAEYNTAVDALASDTLMLPMFILSVVLFVLQFALAYKGNALYKYHCENKIQTLRLKTPDITSAELAPLGGTASWVAIVAYFVSNLVTNAGLYLLLI